MKNQPLLSEIRNEVSLLVYKLHWENIFDFWASNMNIIQAYEFYTVGIPLVERWAVYIKWILMLGILIGCYITRNRRHKKYLICSMYVVFHGHTKITIFVLTSSNCSYIF